MKFQKGLHTDSNPIDQPEGTYRFAKNLVDNNITFAKENEEGFTAQITLNDLGAIGATSIIGIIPVGSAYVVFLTDDTECEIQLVSNLTTTTIYNDTTLNFRKSNPIKGEYRVDVFGNRIIAWQDALNPDRILNIDDLTGVSSVDDMAIDQSYFNPQMTISLVDTGGSLPSGAYVLMTKNKGSDGSETDWYVHDQVAYINDESRSVSFNDCDGCEPGTLTNKAIQVTFTDGDTRYETLVIGMLQIINGVVRAFQVIEKPNGVSVSHLLSGNEQTTELSLDEVLTPPARYRFSKTMTQVSGQLVRANLTGEAMPDFQKYANGIAINYESELQSGVSNFSSHKDLTPPTFIPGEVYAFYIGLNLKKGGWIFYHIPGRAAVGTSPTDHDTDSVTADGMTYLRYQVENTSDRGADGATTNMGYWENQNEVYPDHVSFDGSGVGNPNLRGVKVRHHRMPSLDYLVTNTHTGSVVGITDLPRLDISVTNVIIPSDIQDQINGWKIFFAKKTVADSIVMGSDLLQFGCAEEDNLTVRGTGAGNWDVDSEQAGTDDWRDMFMETDTLRSHSLDLFYDRSRANPNYAEFFYTLERNTINTQYSGFRSAGAQLTRNGDDRGQVAAGVIDYTVTVSTIRDGAAFRKRLDNFKFLPANSVDGKFKSNGSESVFVADIDSPSTDFDDIVPGVLRIQSTNEPPAPSLVNGGIEYTKYYHLHRLISSAHTSFFQQDLIPLTGFADPTDTTLSGCQGGDGFICFMSYLATCPKHPDSVADTEGGRIWRAYVGYAKNNWNFRHEAPGIIGTKYYGKTDVRFLFSPYANDLNGSYISLISTLEEQNQLRYNQDYSKLNEFITPVIFNPDLIDETNFDTLVIWSTVQGEDSRDLSWRTFPSGNRYTMPRHRGPIINIQGVRNRDLLIHHQHSLFKTMTDSSLSGDGENIFLKSNTFFSITPVEILSTEEGYAGCQHKFGARLTKAGYVFPDDAQGKVFIYDGDKLKEISAYGNRRFFRDTMKLGLTDNPFTSNGYTVGYDERYNRILLSKKGGTSFTISYDPAKEQWISYHDYIPDHMFRLTSDILYSVKGMTIWRHQDGAVGTYYTSAFPSILDVALPTQETMIFTGVNWRTECFDTSGVLQYDTTFSHITPMTTEQCGGRIAIVRPTDVYEIYDANCRVIHGRWYFNQIRDVALVPGFRQGFANNFDLDLTKLDSNQDWYENRKIMDNFLICRLEFPNTTNLKLAIYDIGITYRDGTR